jgi:hypothetical protein
MVRDLNSMLDRQVAGKDPLSFAADDQHDTARV